MVNSREHSGLNRRIVWDRHGALKCSWEVLSTYELAPDIDPLEQVEQGFLLHEKSYNAFDGSFEIHPSRAFGAGVSRAPFLWEPMVSRESTVQGRIYNPLDENLIRKFAQLKSADDCLYFARQYGLLGFGLIGREDDGSEGFYEPHNLWLSEASTFNFLLEVSDLEGECDDDAYIRGLKELCVQEYRNQELLGYPGKRSRTLALAIFMKAGGSGDCPKDDLKDLRQRAKNAVITQTNLLLNDRVDFQVWDSTLKYVIVVRNLLAAMTLSLVQYFTQKSQGVRMCSRCEKPFHAIRWDAKFCSPKCRTRESREKARERRQEGLGALV